MEIFENEYCKQWIEDGILYHVMLAESYDEKMIEGMIEIKYKLTAGKSYPMLSDTTRMKHMTREARERSSKKDVGDNLTAVAMLVKSKVQVILFNFYNKVYKAPNVTRIFHYTQKDEAIAWLEQYKCNNF